MYKIYTNVLCRPPRRISKILLIMKLTTVLLILTMMQVSASTLAQQLTLNKNKVTLNQVFKEIRKQTGYNVFWQPGQLNGSLTIDAHYTNTPLTDVMNDILNGKPLTYTIDEKTIIISEKTASLMDKIKAVIANIDVHGRVTGDDNQPLSGATVIVKGGSNSTSTDANGYFTLKSVDPNATLVISFIGFKKMDIKAKAELGNIKLVVSLDRLDEVKVIAYGQITERLNVGNISSVSAKEIEEQPVNNPLLTLQGRVPGLYVTQANGLPGSGVTLRIQGVNSYGNGNDPLFVIDGVPYGSQLLSGLEGGLLGNSGGLVNRIVNGSGNPLSYINSADIESISILKDAAATAIYGSRAANGAILITTKKGNVGETRVDLNIQNGSGRVSHFLDVMNTQQYLQMRNEALRNDGIAKASASDYDLNGLWDPTRYTDWQKALIGGTAQYAEYNVSVSGGAANTQYLVGGTFHRETTVFPGDFSDRKGSVHFNINNASTNQRFHTQLSASYLVDNNQLPGTDLTALAIRLAPNAPTLYNLDGSLNWAPNASGASSWTNPLATNYNTNNFKVNNLISHALFSYQLMQGLTIQTSFGYNNMQLNGTVINPLIAVRPENRPTTSRVALYENTNINSWIAEPQIAYQRSIGKGKLNALIGGTIQQNNSTQQQLAGTGYNSDQNLLDIAYASSITPQSIVNNEYRYNAIFGRLNYNWNDHYLIDLTIRRDGSSRFGPANEFHNFGAVGFGWIFSEETLIKDHLSWISYGKLRASYGTTGNDQIGDYRFLSLYNPYNTNITYQGVTGLLPAGLSNPYLQWEETRKLQVGLDLGLFKDRILLNATYYRNRSSNQLLDYSLPIQTGFNTITENFPATLQNTGIELSITSTNLKKKNFSWSTSFNLTIPHNKLLAFPNLANTTYASSLAVGQPFIGITPVYRYAGVNPSTGQYQFYTKQGGLTYTPSTADRTDTVYVNTQFYGGMENRFTYKEFELSFLVQFVKQIAPDFYFASNGVPGGLSSNQPTYVLDRWQSQGDIAGHEKYNQNSGLFTANNTANSSDKAFGDASYLSLQNVACSWQVPKQFVSKLALQHARLFIQGQNLLTITPYRGLDPRTRSNATLPVLRVITFGVNAEF